MYLYAQITQFKLFISLNSENGIQSPPRTNNTATSMASPRRSNQRPQSTIPQALAQGAIAMAKRNAPIPTGSHVNGAEESRSISATSTASTVQMVVGKHLHKISDLCHM